MGKNTLAAIFAILLLVNNACAQEAGRKDGFLDNIIGSTFKSLAKAFVLGADFNKLKKDNIKTISKMSEEKFRKEYLKAYNIIKDYPPVVKKSGLKEDMTKNEAIKRIKALTKKEAYETIDSVPNSLIAGQFRLYLNQRKQEIRESSLFVQVQQFWNKILEKIYPDKKK